MEHSLPFYVMFLVDQDSNQPYLPFPNATPLYDTYPPAMYLNLRYLHAARHRVPGKYRSWILVSCMRRFFEADSSMNCASLLKGKVSRAASWLHILRGKGMIPAHFARTRVFLRSHIPNLLHLLSAWNHLDGPDNWCSYFMRLRGSNSIRSRCCDYWECCTSSEFA